MYKYITGNIIILAPKYGHTHTQTCLLWSPYMYKQVTLIQCTMTHRVDVIDLILPLIILSLDPVSVEVLTDSIQHSTTELVLLPHRRVELEHHLSNQPISTLKGEKC